MSKRRRDGENERGQIIVLFVFAMIIILAAAALVIDVGVLRNANQNLWNALDAGALAGASQLPADATNATDLALKFADENYPGGLPAGTTIGFRCVVANAGGVPKASEIPAVCDPGPNASWTCNSIICASECVPNEGDVCNTIVLEGTATVGYDFGAAIGVGSGTTKTVLSAACHGPCGTKPDVPVDLVLMVDRTPSMDAGDLANARAAADAVRKSYRPADQWMAFGMIGPSKTVGSCKTKASSPLAGPADLWVPVQLSGLGGAPVNENYNNTGTVLATAISCFDASDGTTATDLADLFPDAVAALNKGRADAVKGIIMMTDGQPNNSWAHSNGTACSASSATYDAEALAAANNAKKQGIEIFTIGFGLGAGEIHGGCGGSGWPTSGQEVRARKLLAGMATDSVDAGCPGTSNDDGDHFYCIPKGGGSTNLVDLFKQAANALVGGTKLIKLP